MHLELQKAESQYFPHRSKPTPLYDIRQKPFESLQSIAYTEDICVAYLQFKQFRGKAPNLDFQEANLEAKHQNLKFRMCGPRWVSKIQIFSRGSFGGKDLEFKLTRDAFEAGARKFTPIVLNFTHTFTQGTPPLLRYRVVGRYKLPFPIRIQLCPHQL